MTNLFFILILNQFIIQTIGTNIYINQLNNIRLKREFMFATNIDMEKLLTINKTQQTDSECFQVCSFF